MQFQSDLLSIPVAVPNNEELSGIGAAYAAGFALGSGTSRFMKRKNRTRYTARWTMQSARNGMTAGNGSKECVDEVKSIPDNRGAKP